MNIGVHIDGAQVHISYLSLKDYIASAFKVKLHQIIGPDWLGTERYNIDATLPAGSTRDDFPAMLQSLLEQRFELKYHRETRDLPAYVLTTVAKGGLKLKPVETDGAEPPKATEVTASGGASGTTVSYGNGSYFTLADDKVEGRKLTMQLLADLLARFVDLPVVNQTGVDGAYNFTLQMTPEDYRAVLIHSAIAAGVVLPPQALQMVEGNTMDSLFSALQADGLHLEKRKAPIQVLVVDSALKTPAEN